ncbi:MAG: hypothetical protein MRERV_32c021 [Mycoplasmataceae bacterium RV_VA103A]|nr:MAG: hypothetical protein MRERV_32c021 [Mycoplasmataceae bacterium RV_VA103A]
MKNLKYIAIGILVGYLGLYVYDLATARRSISLDDNK